VTALVRAEVRKLRSTLMIYGLAAGALALTALGVVGTILGAGKSGAPRLETSEGVRNVFGSGGTASIFALILGILLITGEFRHGTITQAFLITPARARVVGAKVVAIALMGVALGLATTIVMFAVAVPWLSARDVSVPFASADVVGPVGAALASTALFGIIGVGFGALVRNQVAAIIIALSWMFVVEGLVIALLPSVGRWLPQGAARGLTGETLSKGAFLPPWASGLLLLAYGLGFAIAGAVLLSRRDIT